MTDPNPSATVEVADDVWVRPEQVAAVVITGVGTAVYLAGGGRFYVHPRVSPREVAQRCGLIPVADPVPAA